MPNCDAHHLLALFINKICVFIKMNHEHYEIRLQIAFNRNLDISNEM